MSAATLTGTTLGGLVAAAARTLREAGIERAWNEATLLACHALGLGKAALLTRLDQVASAGEAACLERLVARRAAGEPIAYLLGEREFYGRSFRVDRRVLIPRPETELLVDAALDVLRGRRDRPFVVDVGTGSGCIAATLALEAPPARFVALDLSGSALDVARANLDRLGLAGRVGLVRGDLLDWLRRAPDVVVANLPYVPAETWQSLPPDVRHFEPRPALDGGPGGAGPLRRLIGQAAALGVGGLLAELDPRHAGEVRDAARAAFPSCAVEVRPDLAGLDRVLTITRPG